MAYGIKYRIYFRRYGEGTLNEIRLLEKDYSGSETESIGGVPPVMRNLKSDNDEFDDLIRSSNVEFCMNSETDMQFINLFTYDTRKYRVEWYENSSLKWMGWLVPDTYKEPYAPPSYEVKITATDGILSLKNIDFSNNGTLYTGKKTWMEIIYICLSKLNLELGLHDAVNIYETNFDSNDSDSPLTQAYVDCYRFLKSDGDPLNCYEVLEEILKCCNYAQFWQESGYWNIVPVNVKRDSYLRRIYTDSGSGFVYSSYETHDPNSTIDYSNIYLLDEPEFNMRPAWKKLVINQDYGYNANLIKNTEFTVHGTVSYELRENNYLYFYGAGSFSFSNYIRWNVGMVLNDNIQYIRLKLSGKGELWWRVHVILTAGGITYYLKSNGEWGSDFTEFTVHQPMNESIEDVISDSLPMNGYLSLRVYNPTEYRTREFSYPARGGCYIKDIQLLLETRDTFYEENQVTTNINPDHNYEPDEIDMMLGDLYDVVNNNLIYDGGIYYKSGLFYYPTSSWTIKDSGKFNTLVNTISDQIAMNHIFPQEMISGNLEGDIEPGTVLILRGKKYVVHRGQDNPYENEWNLDIIELTDTEQSYLKLRTGGYLKLRTGGKIKLQK